MTTIAFSYKNKQIAIDSRITSNGTIRSDSYDKTITNDLGVWFFEGSCCDMEALSILKHDDKVDIKPDASALLVNNGDVYLVIVNEEGYCEWFKTEHDCAYGGGQDFALAALDFGKSVYDSVKYSFTRNFHSGGEIRVYDIEKGKFI